eukprot:364863-Chlamydomonas_euryale.AAC.8
MLAGVNCTTAARRLGSRQRLSHRRRIRWLPGLRQRCGYALTSAPTHPRAHIHAASRVPGESLPRLVAPLGCTPVRDGHGATMRGALNGWCIAFAGCCAVVPVAALWAAGSCGGVAAGGGVGAAAASCGA